MEAEDGMTVGVAEIAAEEDGLIVAAAVIAVIVADITTATAAGTIADTMAGTRHSAVHN